MPGSRGESRPRLLPMLIVGGLVVVVGLTVLGWIIGTILSAVRFLVIVAVAVAVILTIASARSDR